MLLSAALCRREIVFPHLEMLLILRPCSERVPGKLRDVRPEGLDVIENPSGLIPGEIIEPSFLRNALLAGEVAAHGVLVQVADGIDELVIQLAIEFVVVRSLVPVRARSPLLRPLCSPPPVGSRTAA